MTEKELLTARQTIIQKLTQARLEKGLSQEQLAKKLEQSVPTSAVLKEEHKTSPLT